MKPRNNRQNLLVIQSLLFLMACNPVALKPDMSAVDDRSESYQKGYQDGCHSGYVSGGSFYNSFKKDTARLETDDEYRRGWMRAYDVCKKEFRTLCKESGILSKATLYCSDVRQQGLDK